MNFAVPKSKDVVDGAKSLNRTSANETCSKMQSLSLKDTRLLSPSKGAKETPIPSSPSANKRHQDRCSDADTDSLLWKSEEDLSREPLSDDDDEDDDEYRSK